jgi:SAM-dependent methyltransferase
MTTLTCRSCGAPLSRSFVDLGRTPLANSYVPPHAAGAPDPTFPLHARICDACLLVQVEAVTPPEDIFGEYAYFSSYSSSWVAHAKRFCEDATRRFGLSASSLVVEVASNDGYLLRHFLAAGIGVLGIEPAANVAEAAKALGIPVEVRFFGRAAAADLVAAGRAADLVVANNVLAHVPDLNDFVAGLARVLKPAGVLSVEFPHLLNLVREVQFDTIYHEHYCYFSLLAVERAFARHGLRVFDVETLPTHGGSLRVLACRADGAPRAEEPGLARVRAAERAAGLDRVEAYAGFQAKVDAVRDALLAFLRRARAEGRKVAAYGAAAKGNTLLNYCGIGIDLVEYVVDLNPHKQGRLLPGSRLPVHAPSRLAETRPDYVLVLPWNIAAEITSSMAHVRGWGGRFVVAVPTTRLLD